MKNKCSLFIFGEHTATLIIPIEIVSQCGINKSDKIIIENKDNGIFIRKLSVEY